MKIIWSIIGIILQVIGSILKRSDMLFLGYYLAGTGKTRSLPEYIYDTLVDELLDTGINNDSFEVYNPRDSMIITTVGKFWVRVEDGCFIIKDRYLFYPVCGDADTHFSDCDCTDKEYANLYKSLYFQYKYTEKIYKSKLYKKIRNPKIHVKVGKFIELFLDVARVGFTINDEFWVRKGKPFEVYSKIPVTKI